jgi:hypothetical protein
MAFVKRREVLSFARENETISAGEITPVFIRLPAPGKKCPRTGLSRSMMADLCVKSDRNPRPPVKSFRVPRHKGDKRAVRLVDFQSLMAYLRKFYETAA